jgi:hypothetical protein
MAAMQRSFQETVPQTQARQVSSEKSKDSKARMEALKEEQGIQKGQKLRNPVEAWPAELVFFGRVTNLLRGLCSRLDVRYPYLHTMALSVRKTRDVEESLSTSQASTMTSIWTRLLIMNLWIYTSADCHRPLTTTISRLFRYYEMKAKKMAPDKAMHQEARVIIRQQPKATTNRLLRPHRRS